MAMRGLLAFVLGVCCLARAEDSGSAAPVADTSSSSDVVHVPGYPSDAATTPRFAAFARDYDAYQAQIVQRLKSSPDPRDWALAATGFRFGPDVDELDNLRQLKRAVDAMPDDVLLLWMAVNGARGKLGGDVSASALEKLKSADADNGAVWLEVLSVAARNHDHDGVSAALERMSATSQFNNHFIEMSEAIIAAYRRYPMPDALYAEAPDEFKATPKDAMPLIYATTVTAAFALPAFQTLTTACRTDATGRNADRAANCRAIGRTMEAHSDTLIGMGIGSAVLRLSRTFDESDVAVARDVAWLRTQLLKLEPTSPDLQSLGSFHQDWLASNSETDATRKRLERAGVAGCPPNDWIEKDSRFSPEVMSAEENYFADHHVDY